MKRALFHLALLATAVLLLNGRAYAGFSDCVEGLRPLAREKGISEAVFDRATRGLEPNPDVLAALTSQPEFKTAIWDYLAGLVDDERVADGRAMLQRYAQAFAQAQSRYGVDPAVIAAVWGVESDFGRSFGKKPVIQSLATLSCGGGRQAYFRSEFMAALKIIDNGDIDASQFNGSWAGAFGHTQFMPSTFLKTAVDMDGDGRRDIIGSVPDALGSTAAYLRKSNWSPGLPWGFEVRLPSHYTGPSGRTRREAMGTWAARGITHIDGRSLEPSAASAALLLPAGTNGPAFLVTKNFDAIYSYNAAESYALAIALLSDRLKGKPGLVTPWPTNDPGLSRADRRELQTRLMRRGYDLEGKADGVIGAKTRNAILDFQARSGLPPDGRASVSVLTALRR